jgi:ornithine carbamoyltransferase
MLDVSKFFFWIDIMKHLANLKDLSEVDIQEILDKSAEIKANPSAFENLLHQQSLAMIFQKTSTRTRVSFEVAMTELGGHALYIDWDTSNFVLSGIQNETEYLSRNVSCIMARLLHHDDLLKIIEGSQVPVINGCCEKYHPCQALTDILTIREHAKGPLTDTRLTYVGVKNNVSNSMVLICHKLGINLTLSTPQDEASDSNGEDRDAETEALIIDSPFIHSTTDPVAAVQNADFVYTDTWINMEFFNNPAHVEQKDRQLKKMLPYQVNAELLKGIDCKIMHDMPIHDGYEITADMVRDPRSIIFQQAENRLHAQKGLLWWLYREAGQL